MEKEMAEHNMRLMEEKLRRAGFGDKTVAVMREKVGKGVEHEFYIPYEAQAEGRRFSGYVQVERLAEGGHYALGHFSVDLGKDSGRPLRENSFYFTDGYDVGLREGFNLMQGREVYREPLFDTDRRGYWMTLNDAELVRGVAALKYERATRQVEEGIAVSPLTTLLSPEKKKELVEALKRGDRMAVIVETRGLTRQVWVEMDPVRERLLLSDRVGKLLSLPELGRERRVEARVERRRGRRI